MAEICEQGVLHTRDGLNLFFRRDIPRRPKGIAVLLHALAEHSGRLEALTRSLNASGYGVYRFDCRGHGRSDGPRGDVHSFHDYVLDAEMVVEHARRTFPGKPLFLIGQGLGGLVAASYAAEHPGVLSGEITVGAPMRLFPALSFLNASEQLRHRERGDERFSLMLPLWQEQEPDSWSTDSLLLDSVTVRLAGNVWLYGADWFESQMKNVVTPLFILHGEDDALVPAETSRWFYEGISSPDRALRTYPHLSDLLDERSESLRDIVAWLDAHSTEPRFSRRMS